MDTITLCVERMEARSELLLRSGKRIAGRAETQASQCPACPDACLLLQLPEEILERVLLSTSTKEDLCTFAAVCKKFQRLCVRVLPTAAATSLAALSDEPCNRCAALHVRSHGVFPKSCRPMHSVGGFRDLLWRPRPS